MDIRWILRGQKGFLDFVPVLENFERDNLFQTDFMKSLTHEYWMAYLKKIIARMLVPWIIYSALSLAYFAKTLDQSLKSADSRELAIW